MKNSGKSQFIPENNLFSRFGIELGSEFSSARHFRHWRKHFKIDDGFSSHFRHLKFENY